MINVSFLLWLCQPMRTRLGLKVLKDTKHLSVRTRRGAVAALRGAAAIQYVNSQYIRITIANSPLCYMTVYFLYSGLRNSTIIYCNETSLDLTSQICLLHRSLEIGCFSSAKWGVMLTPRPFIQCISYFFPSQLWRNYSLIFISFNLLSTYFH